MEERTQTPDKKELCAQLAITDESIRFLILAILSVLLSFWSVLLQRKQLCLTLEGDLQGAAAIGGVFFLKIASSALVVGSLGYFFMLSLQSCQTAAAGNDCVAQHSASMNVWAGLLVLTATLIRLYDINFVENHHQAALLAQDDLFV